MPVERRAPLVATGPPRFTVVVPARDEERHLGRTLDSLRRQDFRGGVEVIVVDNGSTDRTAQLAAEHGATVLTEPVPGVCSARQRGTQAARGELVVSTDADTTHPRDWLRRIDAAFRREPRCVAVAGPCEYVGAPRWAAAFTRSLFAVVAVLAHLTGRVVYVTATNTAFRRSAWTGYDTRLTQGGDELDLVRRLRRRGRVVFDRGLVVQTSARRLRGGLLHTAVVVVLVHYLAAYLVNRVSHRPVVGTAPPGDAVPAPRAGARLAALAVAVLAALLVVADRGATHAHELTGALTTVWSSLR